MSIKTEWQSLGIDESKGKYKLIFAKGSKGRNCSVKCCRNPRTEEVYHSQGKLIKTNRRTCNKCRSRLYRANNPIKDAYRQLRGSAKKRDIPFTIKYKEFEILISKTNYIGNKGTRRGNLHIDRIDSELGYSFGNLQVLECSENIAKGNRERFKRQTNDEDPF